jgi:hypothetical protein
VHHETVFTLWNKILRIALQKGRELKRLTKCQFKLNPWSPSFGDMPQGALSMSNEHDVIPLGNLVRQIQHTEFYLRHIAGTGLGVPNLEHGVPYLKHGVPF